MLSVDFSSDESTGTNKGLKPTPHPTTLNNIIQRAVKRLSAVTMQAVTSRAVELVKVALLKFIYPLHSLNYME